MLFRQKVHFHANQTRVLINKGDKFLKKLWCCVGGSIKRYFCFINRKESQKLTFETLAFETLAFESHCSPGDQSLSDLLYSKTKQTQNLKTALRFQRSRATSVNISRVTVNCFPFDVIVFAMLSAHGIWRETVSLLDVM